jgi:hypothetical protein
MKVDAINIMKGVDIDDMVYYWCRWINDIRWIESFHLD